MKKGHQIVKPVLEHFRGLPQRLAELFGNSDVWYRSHGYPLKKDDPMANGNLSAIDHFLKMADEYEAAFPGAGKMLAELVKAELRARYNFVEAQSDGRMLRLELHKEFYEAMRELDKSDLNDQTVFELTDTDKELAEIEQAIANARAHVRAQLQIKKAG